VIHGIKLTICLGASVIDSVPFSTVGGIIIGWAFGGFTFHKAAVRALAQWRDERQRVMRLQPMGTLSKSDDPGMVWVRFDRASWDAFRQEGMK
jgi:hypothetical protein